MKRRIKNKKEKRRKNRKKGEILIIQVQFSEGKMHRGGNWAVKRSHIKDRDTLKGGIKLTMEN